MSLYWQIEERWHIYKSVNWDIIGLGNRPSPIYVKAITRTNADTFNKK